MPSTEIPKWFWKLAATLLTSAAFSMGYGGFAIGQFSGSVEAHQESTEKALDSIDSRLSGIEHRLNKHDLYFAPQPQVTLND